MSIRTEYWVLKVLTVAARPIRNYIHRGRKTDFSWSKLPNSLRPSSRRRPSILLSHRGPLFDWRSAAGNGIALRRPPPASSSPPPGGRGPPLSVSVCLTDSRASPAFKLVIGVEREKAYVRTGCHFVQQHSHTDHSFSQSYTSNFRVSIRRIVKFCFLFE